jgi:hypothetical protein
VSYATLRAERTVKDSRPMKPSRHRNKPRGGGPRQPAPPQQPVVPLPALDSDTGPIVLLAFLALELKAAAAAHAFGVRHAIQERLDVAYERWPEDVAKLEELRLAWAPMSVEVEMVNAGGHPRLVAPRVTLTASSAGAEDRRVEIYLCRRGLVVIETFGWPTEVRAPAILKDPETVADAAKNAAATVHGLMRSLGRFNHPLDMS